jgi:hypothetical protein
VGYVSGGHDPATVKRETARIIERLVDAGFTVSVNRRGRLFRLHDVGADPEDVHLDVRPIWFQAGRVWLHNHCTFEAGVAHFLPPTLARLRDAEVSLPRDSERFLEAHYGPGWRTPDPGFTYHLSDVPVAVESHLARALAGPRELRALQERLRDAPGTFSPTSLERLYG